MQYRNTLCYSVLAAAIAFSIQAQADNLAITGPGAGADGSGKASGTSYGNVRDADMQSYWQAPANNGQRVSVKWSSPVNASRVVVRELGNAVNSWQLVNNDNGAVLASGNALGIQRIKGQSTTTGGRPPWLWMF